MRRAPALSEGADGAMTRCRGADEGVGELGGGAEMTVQVRREHALVEPGGGGRSSGHGGREVVTPRIDRRVVELVPAELRAPPAPTATARTCGRRGSRA